MTSLAERYGPWAVVAGASVGLGAAIANRYAAEGVNVVMVARRADLLSSAASEVATANGVETRTLVADVAAPTIWDDINSVTDDIEVGMFVYNAAEGFRVPFHDDDWEHHERGIRANVLTPALLSYQFGRKMRERGRGSIAICGSMGGMGGQWGRAHYAAGKAYEWVLCEGLWAELQEHGVDVVAYIVGITATPSLLVAFPAAGDPEVRERMMIQTPEECAARLVTILDKGPVAFPSEEHERAYYRGAQQPRGERVLATRDMALSPRQANR